MSNTEQRNGQSLSATDTTLTVVHFNDVYNLEESENEPVGGAARFVTAVKSVADRNPVTFFCGDSLSPSFLGQPFKGKHMIPVLNRIGVDCAVVGNHDLDFGVDVLIERAQESKFPWLLSNCIDNTTGDPLANSKEIEVIERNGVRIGLVGLVDPDWIAALGAVDSDLLTIQDFVDEANHYGRLLKTEHKCDLVIVLTHARWVIDEKLGRECDPDYVDMILGGHDHDYGIRTFERTLSDGRKSTIYLLKSGSDFRDFSIISLRIGEMQSRLDAESTSAAATAASIASDQQQEQCFRKKIITDVQIERVTVGRQFDRDLETVAHIEKLMESKGVQLDEILGEIDVDLDATFLHIRGEENQIGNFICDVMLAAVEADVALLNAGTLRADKVFRKGPFRMRDLQELLPFPDAVLVLSVTGKQLHEAIENSVSLLPASEGRFASVAGLRFTYQTDHPAFSRVDHSSITVADEPLDYEREYRLCTTSFVADGKDGYTMFAKCRRLVDDEEGPLLSNIIINHFHSCNVLGGKIIPLSLHHQSTIPRVQRHKLEMRILATEVGASSGVGDEVDDSENARVKLRRKIRNVTRVMSLARHRSVFDFEMQQNHGRIAPQIEGRIHRKDN